MAGRKTGDRRGGFCVSSDAIREVENMTPGSVVAIRWRDAWGDSKWMTPKEFIKHEGAIIRTVGILVDAKGPTVHVALNVAVDGDLDGIAIPKGCIERVAQVADE
jgi:hypothetical protein